LSNAADTFGSDILIQQNNSWTVTIPSDLKAGIYVVRHELIALQFGNSGNPNGAGTGKDGAQFYPICVSVQVLGSGSAMPPGVKFPGGYKPNDPGILYNLYSGKYIDTSRF
jgi:lytic cellulose monooxygenase (C1-hydroxylating)